MKLLNVGFYLYSRMPVDQKRLAVLIDAENISSAIVQGLFDEIAKLGTASIRKIYGDWTTQSASPWKQTLHKFALQPVQQFSYTSGKNSTDSALIIDAMDILHEAKIDGFCIISSDSDFTRLASRIRESGLIVYGFGAQKTPEAFRQACDQFILVENLRYPEFVKEGEPNAEVPQKSEIKTDIKISIPQPQVSSELAEPKEEISNKLSADELKTLIKSSVDDALDETGWAYLGDVGNIIRNKTPDFDQRTYGYRKLTSLIDSLKLFEIESRKTSDPSVKLIYLRSKTNS